MNNKMLKSVTGLTAVMTLICVLFICVTSTYAKTLGPTELIIGRPHLTLYEHENHKGKVYHQDVGRRCYNLPRVFDNEASSLNTHHKCVKICSRRDCRKCVRILPGTPGHFALREIGYNDAISSFTQC